MLSIIVAMSQNRVIGVNNELPWRLSEDLKRFKQLTMGNRIIMGRKTYESIGKPLPGRENIVLTRQKEFSPEGVTVIHDMNLLQESVGQSQEDFIIGGAQLYEQSLAWANKIYLTVIEKEYEGDAFFPELSENDFKLIEQTPSQTSQTGIPFHYRSYERQ
jgi:dihydrofolate reductase